MKFLLNFFIILGLGFVVAWVLHSILHKAREKPIKLTLVSSRPIERRERRDDKDDDRMAA